MKYQAKNTALSQAADCIVLGVYENNEFSKSFHEINQLTQGYLNDLVKSGELTGKLAQTVLLRDIQGLAAKRVLIVGCGKKGELTERQYKQIIQAVLKTLKEANTREVVSYLTEIELKDRDLYWNIRFAIETIEHTNYQFDHFKSQKAEASVLESFIFNTDCDQAQQAIAHANAISSGIKAARDIANMPPNICNPAYLAEQAKNLVENSTALSLKVVNEEEMSKLGMNAYLAVSKGSENRAYMSILTFNNAPDKNAKPIVLVGKGLTFDAGGISLKPAADMDEMKYDMCGAASVFGTMKAILTTMNGLTVEVLNTDAEGRLVLCDALTYVERFEPELVIDVATLTGACVVALGQHNSGLVSTDNDLANALLQAATETADKAWRLPLSEEYQEQLKSPFADLANIGGRWGGAITAGAFLSNFTKKYRWAHLDIAGTAWLQGANKGATGRPVSLLTQFLINQVK